MEYDLQDLRKLSRKVIVNTPYSFLSSKRFSIYSYRHHINDGLLVCFYTIYLWNFVESPKGRSFNKLIAGNIIYASKQRK